MVPLVTFLIGLAAILAGKSLRRSVAGHVPLCAGCGYDLRVRSAASDRCPECGADLKQPNAPTKRVRRPVPGVRIGGCVLVVLSGLMTSIDYGDRILDRYTNTDRLLWHVEHDHGRDFIDAVDRVATRIREEPTRVDTDQRGKFVILLIVARIADTPWFDRWDAWMDNAVLAGEIADPLRDRYLDHLTGEILDISIQNDEWRAGGPLNIRADGWALRPNALWRFYDVSIRVRLDGEILACPELPDGQMLVPTSQNSTSLKALTRLGTPVRWRTPARWRAPAFAGPKLTDELLQRTSVGPHILQIDFSATLDGGTGISGSARKVVSRSYTFPINLVDIRSHRPVPAKVN